MSSRVEPRAESALHRVALTVSAVSAVLGSAVMFVLTFVPEERLSALIGGSLPFLFLAAMLQLWLGGAASLQPVWLTRRNLGLGLLAVLIPLVASILLVASVPDLYHWMPPALAAFWLVGAVGTMVPAAMRVAGLRRERR